MNFNDNYAFDSLKPKTVESEYECKAENFTTSFEERNITKIVGDHIAGKFNSDVTILTIHLQNTPFLPLNIGAHFPNLKKYIILKSNVQHLMTGDLVGMEKLEYFGAPKNPIKQLGHEFFNGMSELTTIDLHDCHLKRIDAEAFDQLTKLTSIDLNRNDCIDASSGFELGFSRLRAMIERACQGEHAPIDKYNVIGCKLGDTEGGITLTDIVIIFIVVIFSLIAICLVYAVIKIHKGIRQNSWNEMTNNVL